MTGEPRRQHWRLAQNDETPVGALQWATPSGRSNALRRWREAVFKVVGSAGATLKVAWCIEGLSARMGYARARDAYLASVTGLSQKAIERALTSLDRAGAIVRAHIRKPDGSLSRRIFLGWAVIGANPSKSDGTQSPKFGGEVPAKSGGPNLRESSPSVSTVQNSPPTSWRQVSDVHRKRA